MDGTQGQPGKGRRPGTETGATAASASASAPGKRPSADVRPATAGPAIGGPGVGTPVGGTPEGGSRDASSAEGTPAAGTPVPGAPDDSPADGTPEAGPADGTPAGGTPAAGASDAAGSGGTPAPGVPAAGVGPVRVVTLTAGEFTLTVNPVDGSEIEPHRPGAGPDPGRRPAKRDAASRAVRDAAARPPAPPGAPVPVRPLLERSEERERLVRLLQRGRSVRLTGPAGSGRTALLDAVAGECADLAPDGVVRLSGHGQQQPAELLHALYAAVYDTAGRRPDRTALLARVREIGAVVLLDDLELGGPALDELLRATPECAYLLAATPDAKAPSDESHLEEVFLGGLGRTGCTELLETLTGRPLTEAETAWAGDLRFASEGLPLRFVQAAALLRQRDALNGTAAGEEDEEPGVFDERPRDPAPVPLPTLAQAAAPAELLASRVSESARAALRIACALGGELPHPAHLPALVGDHHADAAVAELLGCGLITPVGPRHRLAEGVARQLEEAGYGGAGAEEARTAARHYAWWTGHASVTPERVAAEADAVLAALAGADVVAAVLLARTAAPAFAASLHWDAWERVLRAGAEAARKAGEVAEQAYFHHELGVLALCEGRLDRARAELEASIGLRGALADKRGTVAGRRALALVTDRETLGAAASPPLRLEAPPSPGATVPQPTVPLTKAPATRPPAAKTPATGSVTGSATAVTAPLAKPPAAAPPTARTEKLVKPAPAAQAGPDAPVFNAKLGTPAPAAGPGTPVFNAKLGTPAPAAGPDTPVFNAGPGTPAPAARPGQAAAPRPGSEAVTQVNPVIRRAQLPPPETPKNLSAVFGNSVPPPAPARPAPPRLTGPRPAPPGPARRRRTALLGMAGVLTVAALGTVIGLALASDAPEDPQAPSVSSSPSAQVSPRVPQVPGTGGADPATEPAPPQASGPSGTPSPGHGGTPSPGGTPTGSGSPQPTPTPTPTPTPPPTPSPSPTPTPPPTPSPKPTPTESASSSATASGPTTGSSTSSPTTATTPG